MMKKTQWLSAVSVILCVVLAAATALLATGCNTPTATPDTTDGTAVTDVASAQVIGEGQTAFSLTVTDKDGVSTAFEVHTDKDTVGEALLELGLIDGDHSEYGLYVKTVNGITADYDTDGTYWAFYINGAYAMSGVDTTAIDTASTYELKVEKG